MKEAKESFRISNVLVNNCLLPNFKKLVALSVLLGTEIVVLVPDFFLLVLKEPTSIKDNQPATPDMSKAHQQSNHSTASIKVFTLVLCGLPLWLLVSMEVSKFDQYHGYLSSVSLQLQKAYSSTWILWFKRQIDLELMFSSVISLCTTNWDKWTTFF